MASFATHFSLLTLALLSFSCLSQSQHNKPKHRPFILPIGKDPKTNLFYTSVGMGTPRRNSDLVIDLGGPNPWFNCNNQYNSSTYHTLPCDSKRCPVDDKCFLLCDDDSKPECEACSAEINNPLAPSDFFGKMGEEVLFISHSTVSGLLFGCRNKDEFFGPAFLEGLPKGSEGIIGLARTQFALQTQLSSSLGLPQKFALCLPSSNKKGLGNVFIGGAPQLNASSKLLLTTPLIVNPVTTARKLIIVPGDASYEYFIAVKSIKVGGQVLNFNSSLLSIDNEGIGGTKISTMNAFTVLHSSIYKTLVRDFVKKAADRKIKKVASVAPFGACFDVSTIRRTVTELDVPTIDLVLQGGVQWTIYGANSMVSVKKNVACLGFVDGGKEPRTSVVIGGHQLEDNLLEFDLVSSKLGFSSSLLRHNARCSHFRS